MKNLNIYFIHSKNLVERKGLIDNFKSTLARHNFNNLNVKSIHIVDSYDCDDFGVEIIQKVVNYEREIENELNYLNQFKKNLHKNQLSNSLKHFRAIQLICENSDLDDYNLILEDDVLFQENMCEQLDKLVTLIDEKEHEILFLGFPCKIDVVANEIQINKTKDLFQIIPLIDSYLLKKDIALKIREKFLPVKFLTHIQYQYIFDSLNIKTYQVVPNIFIDGSKYGIFPSLLNANNILAFNKEYMMTNELLNKDLLTEQDKKNIELLLNNSSVKLHPDFQYLKCKYLTREKKYNEAVQSYLDIYNSLIMKGCIVNHESMLLKDFIKLYKHLQKI